MGHLIVGIKTNSLPSRARHGHGSALRDGVAMLVEAWRGVVWLGGATLVSTAYKGHVWSFDKRQTNGPHATIAARAGRPGCMLPERARQQ